MTADEKRRACAELGRSREKKNSYTQGENRKYVFGKPDGAERGFGDCSSTVRLIIKRITGLDIGGNTDAQISNRAKGEVVEDNRNGSRAYPSIGKLKPGDCVYFKGNSAHTWGVGHVEMYIGDSKCLGHGSGIGPTIKNLKSYSQSRTGSRKYLCTIRWIPDDETVSPAPPDITDTVDRTPIIADISEYQGTINVRKMIADGVKLVIQRASCGLNKDKKLDENMAKFVKRGMPYGVYHYVKALTTDEARDEARFFYGCAEAHNPLFYVADMEYGKIPAGKANAVYMAFVDELGPLGAKKIGLYVGHHLVKKWNLDFSAVDFRWISRYGQNGGQPETKPDYACALWQYTSKGRVDGIKGDVDLNRLNGKKPLAWFLSK